MMNQGTNVVGHFVFSKLLIPSLQASAKTGLPDATRVVWTASNGHNFAPKGFVNFDDVNLGNAPPWAKYGQSKAVSFAFIMFFEFLLNVREILFLRPGWRVIWPMTVSLPFR